MKTVLGGPTDFCFALAPRWGSSSSEGMGSSEGASSQWPLSVYTGRTRTFLVVAVFIQHSLCNCQLQAQEKGVKSFSPLLIGLCEKEGADVGKAVLSRAGESGVSRYHAVLLAPDAGLQHFASSGDSKHSTHAPSTCPAREREDRSSQKGHSQMPAVFIFWDAMPSSQSWVVKTTQMVSVISGGLACRPMFSLRALGRTMPSFHHQPLAAVLGIMGLSSSIPSLSHERTVSSPVLVQVSTEHWFLVKTSLPGPTLIYHSS